MQKEASNFCIMTVIVGAFGLLLRWFQRTIIFTEGTDLARAGSPASYLMGIFLVVTIILLWWQSGKLSFKNAPMEPQDALARSGKAGGYLLLLAALIAALGGILLFFQVSDPLLRAVGLAGMVAALILMLFPYLPGWGATGAAFSVIPVVFFCLWLVASYKNDRVNPIMWSYLVQILAVAAGVLAVYHLCAHLFYRAKPRTAVFSCALAMCYSMFSLTDDVAMGLRIMTAGWALGFGVMGWILISNFRSPEEE